MTRTRRQLTMVFGLLTLLLLLPAAAVADDHMDVGELTIEPGTVQPGDSFTVSGECPAEAGGEQLAVLGTDPGGGQLGTVTADADGSFSGDASVSENSPHGDLDVSVPCDVDNVVLHGTLTVAGDEAPVGGVETGFGGGATANHALIALIGALGAVLLAGGGFALHRQRG